MNVPRSTPTWTLRPATPQDDAFLKSLFAQTNAVLQVLPPEWRESLAEMQYRGREMTYASEFPGALQSIICVEDGIAVGRLLIDHGRDAVRVLDIAILPAWQGTGIGTGVLSTILRESTPAPTRVELRVAKDNPAFRLYQRLGFTIVAEDDIAFELACTPPDAGLQQQTPGHKRET